MEPTGVGRHGRSPEGGELAAASESIEALVLDVPSVSKQIDRTEYVPGENRTHI